MKKKVNKNTYDISSRKRVTRKFLDVVVAQNNGKEMYKKSVLHVQSIFSDVVTAVVVALSSLVTSSSKRSRRRFELKTKTRRKIEKHELLRLTIKLKLKGRIFSDNSNRQLKNPIIDIYTN